MNYVNSPQHATKTTTRLVAPTTRVLSRRLADDPYGRTLGVLIVAGLVVGAFLAGQQQQQPVVVIERATASLPRDLAPTPAPVPTALPPTAAPLPTPEPVIVYQEVPVYIQAAPVVEVPAAPPPAPEPIVDHTGARPSDESRSEVYGEIVSWDGTVQQVAP